MTEDDMRVRLRTPQDLAASVPALLGFTPSPDDVVVIGLSDGRVAITLRLDLPPVSAVHAAVQQIADVLARNGADGAVVVLHGHNGQPDVWALLLGEHVQVRDVLTVHAGMVTCRAGCSHPLPDATPVHVAGVMVGQVIQPDRHAVEERIAWSGTNAPPMPHLRTVGQWRVDLATVPRRDARLAALAGYDHDTLAETVEALCVTARHTPPWGPLRDRVLTVLAVAAYLHGDGALAGIALDGIRTPTGLTAVLDVALRNGLPPQGVRESLTWAGREAGL